MKRREGTKERIQKWRGNKTDIGGKNKKRWRGSKTDISGKIKKEKKWRGSKSDMSLRALDRGRVERYILYSF